MLSFGLGVILGAIVLLLLFSAFFSGSETALTAASRARMHHLAEEGNKRARTVLRPVPYTHLTLPTNYPVQVPCVRRSTKTPLDALMLVP